MRHGGGNCGESRSTIIKKIICVSCSVPEPLPSLSIELELKEDARIIMSDPETTDLCTVELNLLQVNFATLFEDPRSHRNSCGHYQQRHRYHPVIAGQIRQEDTAPEIIVEK